jgi:hypothetical protein
VPPRWDGITVDPAIVNGDAVSERCDSLYDESSRRRVCMPRRRLCAAALLQPPAIDQCVRFFGPCAGSNMGRVALPCQYRAQASLGFCSATATATRSQRSDIVLANIS